VCVCVGGGYPCTAAACALHGRDGSSSDMVRSPPPPHTHLSHYLSHTHTTNILVRTTLHCREVSLQVGDGGLPKIGKRLVCDESMRGEVVSLATAVITLLCRHLTHTSAGAWIWGRSKISVHRKVEAKDSSSTGAGRQAGYVWLPKQLTRSPSN
jgi:hypothetical protein